jgi:hypothetical protein
MKCHRLKAFDPLNKGSLHRPLHLEIAARQPKRNQRSGGISCSRPTFAQNFFSRLGAFARQPERNAFRDILEMITDAL